MGWARKSDRFGDPTPNVGRSKTGPSAEEQRVLLGFWRGQRLRAIEPRLKPGGKYEMATIEIREGIIVDGATVGRLAAKAASLNRTLGDPTKEMPRKKA